MESSVKGKAALEALALRFPQLYVAPAEDAREAHRLASVRGIAPEGATLDHFAGSLDDERAARIDEVASEVHGACARIEGMAGAAAAAAPFAFLLDLKQAPLVAY